MLLEDHLQIVYIPTVGSSASSSRHFVRDAAFHLHCWRREGPSWSRKALHRDLDHHIAINVKYLRERCLPDRGLVVRVYDALNTGAVGWGYVPATVGQAATVKACHFFGKPALGEDVGYREGTYFA